MSKIELETERLFLYSRTIEEMKAVYERETDAEMKQAYLEMCELMVTVKGKEEYGCDWCICLKDGTEIGGVGFKGLPDKNGTIEIGYGIDEPYQRHGYATESVKALTEWGLKQPNVKCVQAQTDVNNEISKRVLQKNGFVRNGDGDEGPMYERRKQMDGLCEDIRFLTDRALWETENLIACIPDELWEKRYDGLPMWKYLYHMLYSMDRWYINPCDSSYRNPAFHTDTLADLNVVPGEERLERNQVEVYFNTIKEKIQTSILLENETVKNK